MTSGETTSSPFMLRALELAARGLGTVAPNPLVGCVIVHNDRIIGQGWHHTYGKEHAEVHAINSVNDKHLLPSSTLYVTLEPCNHHGKTPPCSELIVQYHIPKAVIATIDPNPLVAGKGITRLREAGVEVVTGIHEREAVFQNRRFFTFQEQKRPYVILKWAETADGYMDILRKDGETGSFPLSGPEAQRLVHRWRTEEAAILVGAHTALNDNPRLTARLWPGRNPIRILIDPNLRVPAGSYLLDGSVRTLIFNRLETRAVFSTEYIQLDFSREVLPDILHYLHYEGIQSVLVEGGAYTLQRFIRSNLWDEIRIFRSGQQLHQGLKAPVVDWQAATVEQVGADRLYSYYNKVQ